VKPSLVSWLACPECRGELVLHSDRTCGAEVEEGRLECSACDGRYPILRGVPRFAPVPEAGIVERTSSRFGNQWRHFRERFDEFQASFLDWVSPLTPEDFSERIVLDAGCGMGRFTDVAASFGARAVIGVDLSEAVEIAHQGARERENAHVVQADLRKLPLRRVIELTFSLGVLHHIPDGAACLAHLASRTVPGGTVHIWVYGREGNEWLLRFVDPVRRALTSRLPFPLLWVLALLVTLPLHLALMLVYRPAAGRRTLGWLPYRPYLTWLSGFPFRHTHQVVFDHLGAPLARYLTREEVAGWIAGAGLVDPLITARNANSWRGTARVPPAPE
jgi:SAM-dependent methyltransferase/uncharacterized protein YbaR (Trm112 family)